MNERRSVAGVALKAGKVFAAKRRSGGDLGGKWEFPGGKVRPGEDDKDALAREFDEELSLAIKAGPALAETRFIHNETNFTLAAYLVEFPENPTGSEHSEYRWFYPAELESLDFAPSDRALFPAIRALFTP